MKRLHGLASRRQLVDDAHVEVAVKSHRKGARNGGGGHHQNVRDASLGAFLGCRLAPQFRSLCHAEAVLLVNHDEAEARELHRVLDDSMRSHQYMHLARSKTLQNLLAFLAFHDAREQFHAHRHVAKKLFYRGKMLLGENLCRSHDACLIVVVYGYQHRHQGHKRLSRAHVSLQQTVHLLARNHVFPYFADNPFLCFGQREGQVVVIERVEHRPHVLEHKAAVLAPLVGSIAQDVQLHVEEFLELESLAGVAHLLGTLRIMDVPQCRVARHEPQAVDDEWRQRLGNLVLDAREHVLRYLLHGVRCHPCLLHLLRGVVVGLHPHGGEFNVFRQVNLGMHKLIAPAKYRWLAEDDVFGVYLQVFRKLLGACEPHDVNISRIVGEVSHDAFLACSHAVLLEIEELAHYLHERHLAV